jgi:hypothetical protein
MRHKTTAEYSDADNLYDLTRLHLMLISEIPDQSIQLVFYEVITQFLNLEKNITINKTSMMVKDLLYRAFLDVQLQTRVVLNALNNPRLVEFGVEILYNLSKRSNL